MTELTFLGTAGFVATGERDNVAFVLSQDKDLVLVDCPGSVYHKLTKAGLDPKAVRALLVTHIHPDHIYGLPSLIHSLMLDDRELDLFGSETSVSFCRKYLDMFHLLEAKIRCRVNFKAVQEQEIIHLMPWIDIYPMRVPHHESSCAYFIKLTEEDKLLVYSGDTPEYPPLFMASAGADYLIHDCSSTSTMFAKYPFLYSTHTHSLKLGSMAAEAGIKCLIPCHFFSREETLVGEIEKEIKQNFFGKIIIPNDLDRLLL
ncbi:MAG: MBL fold metallo-hydrolase [Candidatus Aminicenantes bacterium]|nr:MBL fold metallo-hydrolase [Candidatus Aminicenantes bacterium]